MKTFSLPARVRGLIFDLDSTLYEHPDYARDQVEAQIALLARRWGRPLEALRQEIYQKEEEWARTHGGRRPSFGNLLKDVYDIPIPESVRLREEAIHPERWLEADPDLRQVLLRLRDSFGMVLLTNNPSSIGWRSLRALGVEDCFQTVVGLETTLKSKPNLETFQAALQALGLPPGEVVSVGDRYAVDIEPALALGMGGVLVEGLADTLALGEVLLPLAAGTQSNT